MRKNYFNLTELLIVLGGVVLLLTIGATSVEKAVKDRKQVTCEENLKKLSLAIASYAEENNDCTPESRPGNTSGRNWWKLIAINMEPLPGMKDWNNPGLVKGQFGPFKCPENTKQIYLSNYFNPQDDRTQSYCANTYKGYDENRYMGSKSSSFKEPKSLVALFEGNFGRVAVWNETANDSPEKVSEPRHDGSMNVLYADGHIAPHKGGLSYVGGYVGGPAGKAPSYKNGLMWYAQ